MATIRGQAPYIPPELFARVLAAQSGPYVLRDRAMLLMSYSLGLRAVELANLVIGDVIDQDGQVRDVVRLFITKGNKFREVPLVQTETRNAIATYLATRGTLSHAPLFRSQKGWAYSPNTLQRHVRHLYLKANVKASSHSGRRSFATRLIQRGADIHSVMVLMGHARISTTQKYFNTDIERLKHFAALL